MEISKEEFVDSVLTPLGKKYILVLDECSSSHEEIVVRSTLKSEDSSTFIDDFSQLSSTNWIVEFTRPNVQKSLFRKGWACQHSSKNKKQGTKRNAGCDAKISILIKKVNKDTKKNDSFLKRSPPLQTVLKFKLKHTHLLSTADSYRMGRVNNEVMEQFDKYFDDGMSASQAIIHHESKLIAEGSSIEDMAKSSINPTERQVYHMHVKWRFANFGTIFNPFEKLKEKLQSYEESGFTIKLEETAPWAVMIVTPIMKRAHNLDMSSEIIFMDSTSSCDTTASTVTVMLAATKVGAIPIVVFIHQEQTTHNYARIFTMFMMYFPLAFGGRKEGPHIFMTDDSKAEKSALKQIFPAAVQLLCHFHVAQAEWRWLRERKNGILDEHQKQIMRQFQAVMYANSEADFHTAVDSIKKMDLRYSNFMQRLDNFLTRKDEWVLWFRSKHITRNHNTNNFAEATIRIIKDIMLSRTKAFNVAALTAYITTSFEPYLQRRLRKFAFNHVRKGAILYETLVGKMAHCSAADVLQVDCATYVVPGETSAVPTYTVDVSLGVCSCPAGNTGAFCKHQCFLYQTLNIVFPNAPILTTEDRHKIARLAFDDACPQRSFFKDYKEPECEDMPLNCEVGTSSFKVTRDDSTVHETVGQQNNPIDGREMVANALQRISSFTLKESTLKNVATVLNKLKNGAEVDGLANLLVNAVSRRAGKKIKVQPTSISRRRKGVKRGCGRISAGRPSKGLSEKVLSRKRKRNLNENIEKNLHNAR